jgi:hypothetical protein
MVIDTRPNQKPRKSYTSTQPGGGEGVKIFAFPHLLITTLQGGKERSNGQERIGFMADQP